MSKYRKIEVQFLSETALVQALEDACQQFGIQYEHHEKATHLYGYQGDRREEKAEYVIRRNYVGGAANDIGFARQPDGSFAAIVSEFDTGTGRYEGGTENAKFTYIKQRYAYHQVCAEAEAQGYTVYEEYLPDGSIELALERAW